MTLRVLIDSTIIVSGLFYLGNEHFLLLKALEGSFTLVLPETVIRETEDKIEEKFYAHKNAALARAVFAAIVAKAEIITEGRALMELAQAKQIIRDESDAPILAAALACGPDVLATSDSDYYALKKSVPFRVLRSWQVLKELGE